MQCYHGVEILDLDGCSPKSIHELSKGFMVNLS